MPTCYFCKQNATKTAQVISLLHGTRHFDLCKTCYYKVSYGILNLPGINRPQTRPVYGSQMPPYTRSKKTARLIYEPSLQGYSLSFSFKQEIVDFVKKVIPSNKRTYDPASYTWYFGSEYFDIIKTLFDGHREYTLTIVSEDEVKKKLEEAQNNQSHWAPSQYSIDEELQKFFDLLHPIGINNGQGLNLAQVKNWNKNEAVKAYRKASLVYHPDKNNGDGSKMSELNSTWAILKEGYYIK